MAMFKKVKVFFQSIKPIALSHHPMCDYFKNEAHTLTLFGTQWCIGCFVTYPTAALVFLIFNLFDFFSLFENGELWLIGFSLLTVYIISILGLTKKKFVKITTKFLIGIGIAFCIAGIWGLSTSKGNKMMFTLFFFTSGHFFINSVRGLSIWKTCKKCEYQGDWDTCPGMGPILHPIKEIFKKNKDKKNLSGKKEP